MASQPIILEVDKIRSTDGTTTVTINEMSQAQINIVENDLGISRDDSVDIVYSFGKTPSASQHIAAIDTGALQVGAMLVWNGTEFIDSGIIAETQE